MADYAEDLTTDRDIIRRRWFPVDLDPIRPKGIAATDVEHASALARAEEVRGWLAGLGWPAPILADSGNGAHLLYRVDLLNDEESRDQLARSLAALSLRFSDAAVMIDESVFNAARIWKLYSTLTCKGDPTPERPHRRSAILEAPPHQEVVSPNLLEKLAALAPATDPGHTPAVGDRLDLAAWIEKHGLTIASAGPWNGGRRWTLNPCPWDAGHTNGSAYLVQFPNGAIAAGCHHNGCHGKDWGALRELVEPGWRDQQEHPPEKKARRGKGQDKLKHPLPPELAGRRIHPALHFDATDGLAAVGLVTPGPEGGEVTEVVTSARTRYPTEAIQAALSTKPLAYADLVDRWRPEDVTRFLAGTDAPARFADMVARIIDRLDSLMEFRQDAEAVTVAVWAVASYFFKAFLAFPRLDLRGERGSGKSKLLSILAATSFNGLLIGVPTPAILYRLAESNCPTFALDESEGLDSDQRETLLAIFNMGYKAGGRVPRCEGDKTITIKSWSVFCPLAFGGIKGLNRTTEDRAITLPLVRGKDSAKINAEVDPADLRFAEIRDLGYRLALLRWREVAEAARSLTLPDWLMARERELWKPLLVVAHLADQEHDLGLTADLLVMAKDQGEERAGLSEEAAAVVEVLTEKLAGADSLAVLPGELREDLKTALGWDRSPSAGKVGRLLKGLGFPRAPRSAGGKRRLVTAEALADLRKRYGEPSEGG